MDKDGLYKHPKLRVGSIGAVAPISGSHRDIILLRYPLIAGLVFDSLDDELNAGGDEMGDIKRARDADYGYASIANGPIHAEKSYNRDARSRHKQNVSPELQGIPADNTKALVAKFSEQVLTRSVAHGRYPGGSPCTQPSTMAKETVTPERAKPETYRPPRPERPWPYQGDPAKAQADLLPSTRLLPVFTHIDHDDVARKLQE